MNEDWVDSNPAPGSVSSLDEYIMVQNTRDCIVIISETNCLDIEFVYF